MSKKTLYGIRLRYYEYGDDYNYFGEDHPQYVKLSSDYEEVVRLRNKLEAIECIYTSNMNEGLEYFIGDSGSDSVWNNRAEIMPKVVNLFKEYFNVEVKLNANNWVDEIGCYLKIPNKAKAAQINEIRELLKINFYNIYEYELDDEPVAYRIKYNESFTPKGLLGYHHGLRNYYKKLEIKEQFLDKEKAIATFCKKLYESLEFKFMTGDDLPEIMGKLEVLSKTPAVLEAFLLKSENFDYDFGEQKIILLKGGHQNFNQDFKTLLELLIEKPFTIVEEKMKE